jgi:hypothetical protein
VTNFLQRLLGCYRRNRANLLRFYAYRVQHAETAEERLDIANDAIRDGLIDEVQAMMDQRPLATHEAIAWQLWRELA